MNVRINKDVLVKAGIWKAHSMTEARFEKYSRWGMDTDLFTVDMSMFTTEEMNKLQKHTENLHEWRALAHKIKVFRRVAIPAASSGGKQDTKVGRLDLLEPAMKEFLRQLPNKWLFKEGQDGHMLPYYITKVEYHKAYRRRDEKYPAYVDLSASSSNDYISLRWYAEDLEGGDTLTQLIQKNKVFLENEGLVKNYEAEIKRYITERHLTGKQFRATGHGTAEKKSDSRWGGYWSSVSLEREGRMAKVVMDDKPNKEDDDEDDKEAKAVDARYWLTREQIMAEEERERNNTLADEDYVPLKVPAPVHPFVKVFDLANHRYVTTHVSNLRDYVYDETVGEKLVLPQEKKDLVTVLVNGATNLMEDIVEGKTGGIIVLATGVPGTGKTLTAEVYAEAVKKPLYVVQCSQLGTTSSAIEGELSTVLFRAQRWGAILLIDEADVYVRERGNDIDQSAIVGVFLRVLEYYRGVLFMTSNRATIIDDAVLSRATAHITYDLPDEEQRARIWEVLAAQFKIKLADAPKKFAKEFDACSGRTIKNLLKLSSLMSQQQKKPVDVKLVRSASQFLDGVKKEEK